MTTYQPPRAPVWELMGPTFPGVEASAAIKGAGLDYVVSKRPVYADVAGQRLDIGRYALVREPSPTGEAAVFGLVGRDYAFNQNVDLGRLLDPVTRQYPVVAAGALDNGAALYLVLRGGTSDVAGDALHDHFLVYDAKGTGATSITYAPVHRRTQAVLLAGGEGAVAERVVHKQRLTETSIFQVDLPALMAATSERALSGFRRLADTPVNDEIIERALAAAYPEPRRPAKAVFGERLRDLKTGDPALLTAFDAIDDKHDYYAERVWVYRNDVLDLMHRSGHDDTLWAFYVALCHYEDGRPGHPSAPVSALFGARANAKERAIAVLLQG